MRGTRGRWLKTAMEAGRGAAAIGVLALWLSPSAAQAPDRPAGGLGRPDRARFIVAFELRANRREEFVWPHPTFPAASYERVVLVVDDMPHGHPAGRADQATRLAASQHLRINGRLRAPRKGGSREEFVVELDAGRLRLLLMVPPGLEIDGRHEIAHITLYEADGVPLHVAGAACRAGCAVEESLRVAGVLAAGGFAGHYPTRTRLDRLQG